MGWIEAVYKNIKADDMFDIVTELICRQYSTMVAKGQIDDSIPHINEAGMVIDYPKFYLNKFRDDIRSRRAAEELERKTRHELKQKMMQMKRKEQEHNSQKSMHSDVYDEKTETLNLDVMMKNTIEDYMVSHTATKADIDEIIDSPVDKRIEMSKRINQFDKSTLPEEFQTSEAKQIMQKLSKAGLLDANWQPVNLSIAERGYLAADISRRLNINYKWKVMGELWNENPGTLRKGKNNAIEQKKIGAFIEKIRNILG